MWDRILSLPFFSCRFIYSCYSQSLSPEREIIERIHSSIEANMRMEEPPPLSIPPPKPSFASSSPFFFFCLFANLPRSPPFLPRTQNSSFPSGTFFSVDVFCGILKYPIGLHLLFRDHSCSFQTPVRKLEANSDYPFFSPAGHTGSASVTSRPRPRPVGPSPL